MRVFFSRHKHKNKDEWLDFRKDRIGGSGASAIIGMNPYKSNIDYYKEKALGIEDIVEMNPAIEYGLNAESIIRSSFELSYKDKLKVYHSDYESLVRVDKPYLSASLDGELFCINDFMFTSYFKSFYSKNEEKPSSFLIQKGMKGVLEIKTTEVLSSMHREKWSNQIPQNYYIQILHYLSVTNYDFVILVAELRWEDNNGVKTKEQREYGFLRSQVEDDLKYLEEKETEFYLENVQKKQQPHLIIHVS